MGASIQINAVTTRVKDVPFGVAVSLLNASLGGVTSQKWEIVSYSTDIYGSEPDPVNYSGWTLTGKIFSRTQSGSYPAVTFIPDISGNYIIRLTDTTNVDPLLWVVQTAVVRVKDQLSGGYIPAPGENDEVDTDRGWALERNQDLRIQSRVAAYGSHMRVVNLTGSTIARGKVVKIIGFTDMHTVGGSAVPSGSTVRRERLARVQLANSSDSDAIGAAYALVTEPSGILNNGTGYVLRNGLFEGVNPSSGAVDVNFSGFTAGANVYLNTTGSIVNVPAGVNTVIIGRCIEASSDGDVAFDGSYSRLQSSKFIVQGTVDSQLPNAQFLGALGTGLLKSTTVTGILTIAAPGTDYESPLTFATPGNTRTGNNVTADYITGKIGNQQWYGGFNANDGLTIDANVNATKGPMRLNAGRFGFNCAPISPTVVDFDLTQTFDHASTTTLDAFHIRGSTITFAGAENMTEADHVAYVKIGQPTFLNPDDNDIEPDPHGISTLFIEGDPILNGWDDEANTWSVYVKDGAVRLGGLSLWVKGTTYLDAAINQYIQKVGAGDLSITVNNGGGGSLYLGTTASQTVLQIPANNAAVGINVTPSALSTKFQVHAAASVVSATSAVLNAIHFDAATTSITLNNPITTATGFNQVVFAAPTFNGTPNITHAANVVIGGEPGGTAPATNRSTLWVQSGSTRLAGSVYVQTLTGMLKAASGLILVAAPGTDFTGIITLTAGAGLTGGGDTSTNRTFDVGANADGSIVVNANDIQVGVINDTQHGTRGGGTLHAAATTSVAGFLSASDKSTLANSKFFVGNSTNAPASSQNIGTLTTGLLLNTVSAGVATLSRAVPGTDYQAALTFSTGLTNASNVITSDLSTGKGASQSVIGGDNTSGSGGTLVLSSTSHATKGRILNGSWFALDEVNSRVLIGTQTAGAGAPLTIASSDGATAIGILLNQGAQQNISKSGGDMAIGTLGNNYVSLSTSNVARVFANGSGQVAFTNRSSPGSIASGIGVVYRYDQTVASATGATLDNILYDVSAVTITGSDAITTATGFNQVVFKAPTYNSAVALTMSVGATVYIQGAPSAGGTGPLTITNPLALWVDSGTTRLDGTVIIQTFTGLLKGTSGTVGTAIAGTDYQAPLSAANATISFPTSTTVQVGTLTNKFIVQGTSDAMLSGAQFMGASPTGLVKNTTTTGVFSIATSGTDYEPALTFNQGLSRSGNTISGDYITGLASGSPHTWTASTVSSGALTIRSSSNATKGNLTIQGGRIVIDGTAGSTSSPALTFNGSTNEGVHASSSTLYLVAAGNPRLTLASSNVEFSNGVNASFNSSGITLSQDEATGVLGIRRTSNPTTTRFYNTFTTTSNYERYAIDWSTTSNVATVGTQAAGSGTLRKIVYVGEAHGINFDVDLYGSGAYWVAAPSLTRDKAWINVGGAVTISDSSNRIYLSLNPNGNGVSTPVQNGVAASMWTSFHMYQPLYRTVSGSASCTTVATLYIANQPAVDSGTLTLTNKYSLFVDAGLTRLDGDGTHVLEMPYELSNVSYDELARIPVKLTGQSGTFYIRLYKPIA